MKTYTICQNCVYRNHPKTMLTGYSIEGNCEICDSHTMLMMVKRDCYCDYIKKIYPGSVCDFCSGLRIGVEQEAG